MLRGIFRAQHPLRVPHLLAVTLVSCLHSCLERVHHFLRADAAVHVGDLSPAVENKSGGGLYAGGAHEVAGGFVAIAKNLAEDGVGVVERQLAVLDAESLRGGGLALMRGNV